MSYLNSWKYERTDKIKSEMKTKLQDAQRKID